MQSYKYKEWTYSLDNGNHKVDSPKSLPQNVYKYYQNNDNNKDALLKQYLYCSHPNQLNDSIDCSNLIWDFSNLSKPVYEKFYEQYELNKIVEQNYENDRANQFEDTKRLFYNFITNNLGIISLSEEPLNTLMWSHYSNERGFMLTLDWKIIKENLKALNNDLNNYVFFPVQYVDSIEQIDFFSSDFNSLDVPFLYSSGIKRNDWCYEKEWRLIVYTKNLGIPKSPNSPFSHKGSKERKIYYPKEAIRNIVLGKYFFNNSNAESTKNAFEYKITLTTDLKFIRYLIENFNDRIFWSGEIEKDKILKRSTERIELKELDKEVIKVIRKFEGYHQK